MIDEISELADPLVVVVTREEVDAFDLSGPLQILRQLFETPDVARRRCEGVDVMFSGYDHRREELWEIPEVRNYVFRLDEEFPFWLFFLSKRYPGLQCLALCFMPPYLTQEAKALVFPERLNDLLLKRWMPAMNQMCAYAGGGEDELVRLTDSALEYLTAGRVHPC